LVEDRWQEEAQTSACLTLAERNCQSVNTAQCHSFDTSVVKRLLSVTRSVRRL